jgi:VanZ family protein
MKHPKHWARFFLVASIVTAVLIFWFSSKNGGDSQSMSDVVTLRVARTLRPDFMKMSHKAQQSYLEALSTIVRKNAHFCIFMLLGFNLMGTMRFYFPGLSDGACRLRAMGIAVLYAASDELHQLFISERSAQVLDVLIDSAGSLTGTLVLTLCLVLLARIAGRDRGRPPARPDPLAADKYKS